VTRSGAVKKPGWTPRRIVFTMVAAVVLGGAVWYFFFSPAAEQGASASAAAHTASIYTTDRQAAVDPNPLMADPEMLPTFPAGSNLELDKSTWYEFGNSGSANGNVQPGAQRVTVYFFRVKDKWLISAIEAAK
jgi:hypothetical protein